MIPVMSPGNSTPLFGVISLNGPSTVSFCEMILNE